MLDILKSQQDARQKDQEQTLKDFRDQTQEFSALAKAELPKISAALGQVDRWVAENLTGLSASEVPPPISALLFEIDRLRSTPGLVLQTLREQERITIRDVWGDRREQDPNRLPAVVGSVKSRLYLARGCAAGIDRLFGQLKMVVADIEEKSAWAQATGIVPKETVKTILAEPPALKPRGGVRIDSDF